MEPREMFHWGVTLMTEKGEQMKTVFSSFWSPSYDNIEPEVGLAAASMAGPANGKSSNFLPTAVVRLKDPADEF